MLRAKAFERALRDRLRRERRTSPALAAEWRRQRGHWRDWQVPSWFHHLFLGIVFASFWAAVMDASGRVDLGLAVLALWSLGAVGSQGRRLLATLYQPADLVVLYHLPLTDAQVFRLQTARFVRETGWLLLEYVPAGVALAMVQGMAWPGGLWAVALPPLQALFATLAGLHGAACCAGWLRYLAHGHYAAFILLFTWKYLGEVQAALVSVAWWLPPAGWLNYLYERGMLQGDPWAWLLLLPLAVFGWALPWSWQRLRQAYALHEPVQPLAPQTAVSMAMGRVEGSSFGVTAVEARVRDRAFLAPAEWTQAGWLERVVGRWLNARERLVAEFMLAGEARWTMRLAWGTGAWAVVMLLIWLFGKYGGWLVFLTAYGVLAAAVPLLGGAWPGLGSCFQGGTFTPMYAGFPLGFRDMARVILKTNYVRIAAAVPLILTMGALAGWELAGQWLLGLVLASKVAGLLLALQPMAVLLLFSEGSNDTARIRWRWLPLLVVWVIALVGASVALFLVTQLRVSLLCLLAVALLSGGLLRLYRHAWGRGWFDLVSRRPSSLGSETD